MRVSSSILGLPSSLLLLLASQLHAEIRQPTAIRKMPLDAGEKLFPEYLAFEEDLYPPAQAALSPREAVLAARLQLNLEEERSLAWNLSSGKPYRPAFASHEREEKHDGWDLFRRAADVLKLLEGRQSCPGGMHSCANISAPNKCCADGEDCVAVADSTVGNVACCPQGSNCGGAVAPCPDGSPTCAAEIGGGCCIPGFVCQGLGCVPSPPPAPPSTSPSVTTLTTTETTIAEGGSPSTAVVTVIITLSPTPDVTTSTTTLIVTPTTRTTLSTTSTGAGPPFRPTSSDTLTVVPTTGDYCPTGFYACLARAGGGCCQTGRDCSTMSCPPTPMTTITTDGATIVVPVTDVPGSQATSTCAGGWYMCGAEAGPVAGCCPSGYNCGTASCTLIAPSQTATVQKLLPSSATKSGVMPLLMAWLPILMSFVLFY